MQNWTFWRLTSNYWQAACFFQKTQIIDQSFCCNKEINEAEYFSGGFEAGALRLSQGKYTAFAIRLPWPSSQRQLSLQFLSSVKDTTRTHCTLPWEKVSEPRVLWVLTAIPSVNPTKSAVLCDDFTARNGKQSISFFFPFIFISWRLIGFCHKAVHFTQKIQMLTKIVAAMKK